SLEQPRRFPLIGTRCRAAENAAEEIEQVLRLHRRGVNEDKTRGNRNGVNGNENKARSGHARLPICGEPRDGPRRLRRKRRGTRKVAARQRKNRTVTNAKHGSRKTAAQPM